MSTSIPTSNYEHYCAGYQNPDNHGTGYILGVSLNIGKVPISFRRTGSQMLDKINAFDMAEVTGTYLGETNMITVSSFCGIQGKIWGFDIVKHPNLEEKSSFLIDKIKDAEGRSIPVYSAKPILDATKRLLGTKRKKRFPILPGSHVPCATKHIVKNGPCRLYCALAIGIPKNTTTHACLLMENIGEFDLGNQNKYFFKKIKEEIILDTAKSILAVGSNQEIEYQEIFVEIADISIKGGYMGCALVAAPYLSLAQKAVPEKFSTMEKMSRLSLNNWEKLVESSYLSAQRKNDNM